MYWILGVKTFLKETFSLQKDFSMVVLDVDILALKKDSERIFFETYFPTT
jgi:hypothetical protein